MKPSIRIVLFFIVLNVIFFFQIKAQNNFFQLEKIIENQKENLPQKFAVFKISNQLKSHLTQAPIENLENKRQSNFIISLPMPNGTLAKFSILESPIMEKELAQKFPEIKTYSAQGIDDKTATARFSFTPKGMQGIILGKDYSVYFQPYQNPSTCLSYFKKDAPISSKSSFCGLNEKITQTENHEKNLEGTAQTPQTESASSATGATLRTYRLALAATGEYTQAMGGTSALAMAGIATTLNVVNAIFERDLSIRMVLVANNNLIIYTNPATDPYSTSFSSLITQNQSNITSVIGAANYDIGHVFTTTGGGLASVGVACRNSLKARAASGLSSPTGYNFDVQIVAHEFGHQFGAWHSFYGNASNCSNRSSNSAYEPGSGSTVMAYGGLCASHNIASSNSDYFHSVSLNQIVNYSTTGFGDNCPTKTSTGNNPPVANAGASYDIPIGTPFTLTGSATDPDGDPLTYCWENYDTDNGPGGHPNGAGASSTAPLFRSFPPVLSPNRTFPQMSDIVTGTSTIGETLPLVSRTMNFRFVVRDNQMNGGGMDWASVAMNVHQSAGPFNVTSPNSSGLILAGGSMQNITWNVANTDIAPVNTPNVNILLSDDGGYTYPYVLATNVPNNGTSMVMMPLISSTTARVKVEGAGNIFFDISDNDFELTLPFDLIPTDESLQVCSPNNAVTDIEIANGTGTVNPIALSVLNLPAGLNASFSINPVNPGNNSQLTISNTGSIAGGLYTFVLQGTDGTTTLQDTMSIEILSEGVSIVSPAVCSDINSPIDLAALLADESPNGIWTETSAIPSSPGAFDANDGTFNPFAQALNTYTFQYTPVSVDTGLPQKDCITNGSSSFVTINGNNRGAWFQSGALSCSPDGRTAPLTFTIAININTYSGGSGNILIRLRNNSTCSFNYVSGTATGTGTYLFTSSQFPSNFDISNGLCILLFDNGGNLSTNIQFTTSITLSYAGIPQFTCPGNTSMVSVKVNCLVTTPVPVELIDFRAKKVQNENVLLEWEAANEVNLLAYEVQVSKNNKEDFEKIAWISAENKLNYAFLDEFSEKLNWRYYRLKMIDFDGSFEYSPIRGVQFESEREFEILNIFPNPSYENFNLQINSISQQNINLRLIGMDGKIIQKESLLLKSGLNEFPFYFPKQVADGFYWLEFQSKNEIIRKKILKF